MRFPLLLFAVLLVGCDKKPEDRFVEIRGKAQHILDVGSGSPVVVFVSGFGDRVSSWMNVQRKVAEKTRTLSYDRAGLGESEPFGKNRSLDSIIVELNEILETERVNPPFILVGHSYGGHIIRYFANQYPEKVAGLLLVDPTVEYMKEEFRRLKSPEDIRRYDSLSEHGKDPTWKEGVRNEADYFEQNNETIKGIPFGSIPTTVITAMNTPEPTFDFLRGANEMKVTLHKRWVNDAPQIRHVFAEKSGHYVQFDEPDLVVAEILLLVQGN
jgi:pimeloyl-ACP methyl ester carboxylesterase